MQYPRSFLVLDNSGIDAMLRTIYQERGLTLRDKTFSDAREYIAGIEKYLPENLESTLLPIGARVRHEYPGEGNILEIDMGKGAYLIQFDSIPTPGTISFRAKLLRV